MLGPIGSVEGAATAQLRGRNRSTTGFGVNRVKDGFTLGALRASSGPPGMSTDEAAEGAGLSQTQAGTGRRSTSLFDRTRSGHGVLSRLRGQVRNVSPLAAGVSGGAGGLGDGVAGSDDQAAGHGQSIVAARQSNLRAGLDRNDKASRFLQARSNPLRGVSGYGLRSAEDGQSQFGGGLSLYGGGVSLYG